MSTALNTITPAQNSSKAFDFTIAARRVRQPRKASVVLVLTRFLSKCVGLQPYTNASTKELLFDIAVADTRSLIASADKGNNEPIVA
mmetsp:Transcript_10967/g.17381  ORF Transcript_10967/g.17381 Transcript_10967/m.17381 type:complete len:87 (-) Transcript_10967:33-293(-)